jgi:hypothetical protein
MSPFVNQRYRIQANFITPRGAANESMQTKTGLRPKGGRQKKRTAQVRF